MKKYTALFSILIATLFIVLSCDKIEENNYLTPAGKVESKGRKILLEDYTGHKCQNCPAAATVADGIEKLYPNDVIIVSVHAAGTFSDTTEGFSQDFTTTEGTTWKKDFTLDGFPAGMVNRIKQTTNSWRVGPAKWLSTITSELGKEAELQLSLTSSYIPSTKAVTIQVKATFLEDLDKDLKIGGMLLQDSIIGPQKDGDLVIPNFVFKHVLRQTFGGTWGENFVKKEDALKQNETRNYTFSFTLPEQYKNTVCIPEHCHFVVYVTTGEPNVDESNYQILQCAKVSLINN